jgi:hypothetical protein
MADNTFTAPFSPVQRSTPSDRLLLFQKNEAQIYNKFSPYDRAGGGIGPNQPFIYTKLTDSNFQKNFTKYDTQVAPIGSTARDVIRMTKFSVTGTGVLYLGKQLLLQQQNAFNETRIYNPLSLLKATAKPGSLGLFDRPQRHLETSGGLLNFFKDALLSTIGISVNEADKPRIEGTATGVNGVAYAEYANKKGSARYGLLRYPTATSATSKFNEIWAKNVKNVSTGGGFLQNLADGLVEKLRTMIPSTNPLGAFRGTPSNTWVYRPEYPTGGQGIYYTFLNDKAGLLKTTQYNQPREFYNDAYSRTGISSGGRKPYGDVGPSYYHKYYPSETDTDDKSKEYAPKQKIQQDRAGSGNNIKDTYARMMSAMKSYSETDGGGQFRSSAERYTTNPVIGVNNKNNYNSIPGGNSSGGTPSFVNKSSVTEGPFLKTLKDNQILNDIRIDNRGFAKAASKFSEFGTPDEYNSLDVIKDVGNGNWPRELINRNSLQSKDLIFFYFYDLINKIYIPFRATLGSIQDQHSPDWEDIKYMGRADKLYIYKGFSREVSFSFKVYANSIDELIPMWKRVNYMAGLVRPSKYTDRAYQTAGTTSAPAAQGNQLQSQVAGQDPQSGAITMTPFIVNESRPRQTTGDESGFMYPPMIEFRIGDMYVDQPAILRSVSITIPEDAVWETIQSNEYQYIYGVDKILKKDAYSRQLPTIIDVSVQLSMIEKEKSIVGGNYFGPSEGWENIIT